MLESLKDGKIYSSKYNSQTVKVKTPIIVIVFSNNHCNENELAKDRWKIFTIELNALEPVSFTNEI